MDYSVGDGGGGTLTPRHASRGVKKQLVALGLDTLYLIVEYPHTDIYDRWSAYADDLGDPRLFNGIPIDERNFVLRRGAQGYKCSIWDGDARLYLTNRVEDRLRGTAAVGQGMGMMLQLGPKWLHLFGRPFADKALLRNVRAQLLWFGVDQPELYPLRINRLDIALDVRNLAVSEFSIDEWREGWVGYGKPKNFYFDSRTGQLTGFHVGTNKGNVSLKVYDKARESVNTGDAGFWRSVWDIGEEEENLQVARFEWTFHCHKGKFAGLRYLEDYTFEKFLGLLNYGSVCWGSLRVPQAGETNKQGWPLHPLWSEILAFIDDYSLHAKNLVRPQYDLTPDLKPAYLRSFAGWVAGLQARVGLEKGQDGPASLAQTLAHLYGEGYTFEDIQAKAREKWELFSRLAGAGGLDGQDE